VLQINTYPAPVDDRDLTQWFKDAKPLDDALNFDSAKLSLAMNTDGKLAVTIVDAGMKFSSNHN